MINCEFIWIFLLFKSFNFIFSLHQQFSFRNVSLRLITILIIIILVLVLILVLLSLSLVLILVYRRIPCSLSQSSRVPYLGHGLYPIIKLFFLGRIVGANFWFYQILLFSFIRQNLFYLLILIQVFFLVILITDLFTVEKIWFLSNLLYLFRHIFMVLLSLGAQSDLK